MENPLNEPLNASATISMRLFLHGTLGSIEKSSRFVRIKTRDLGWGFFAWTGHEI